MGPLGELGALFNPGMRHEIEERESKANRREEEGNARDGDLRIDLASGVAVINIPSRPASDAPSTTSDATPESSDSDAAGTGTADGVAASDEPAASSAPIPPAAARPAAAPARSGRHSSRSTPSRAKDSNPAKAGDQPVAAPRPSSKASRAAR